MSDEAFAKHLVAKLNGRSAREDGDAVEVEQLLNPRFGYVAAEESSREERVSIRQQIEAIRDGQAPPVRHRKLAAEVGWRARAFAESVAQARCNVHREDNPLEDAGLTYTWTRKPDETAGQPVASEELAPPVEPHDQPEGKKVERTLAQAADYVGLSTSTMRRWIMRVGGSISSERMEGGLLYESDQDELDRLRDTEAKRKERVKRTKEKTRAQAEKRG